MPCGAAGCEGAGDGEDDNFLVGPFCLLKNVISMALLSAFEGWVEGE